MRLNGERKSVRFVNLLAIVTVVAWCSGTPICADIVTYSVTGGILSGIIGTTNLTNDPYTVTAIGNSANIFYGVPGVSAIPVDYFLSIQGLGTTPLGAIGDIVLFQGPASQYDNGQGSINFLYNDSPFTLGDAAGSVFDTWNLVSPIGPVAASAGFENSDGGIYYFETGLGVLYASGSSGNQVLTVTSTPEPVMFVVCGPGVCLLLAIAYRRRRRGLAGRPELLYSVKAQPGIA
jgi:hypothetical protein